MPTKVESKETLFSTLSLFWIKPDKDLWNEISSKEAFNELRDIALDVYNIDTNAYHLTAHDAPSFSEAVKFHDQILNLSFGKQAAVPVESLYKQWTVDPTCNLPHAHQKGFVYGDSAVYMKKLLEKLEIEIPENLMPDHLAVELNLYSILLAYAPKEQVDDFKINRFDWIEDYRNKLIEIDGESFYTNLLWFLQDIVLAE